MRSPDTCPRCDIGAIESRVEEREVPSASERIVRVSECQGCGYFEEKTVEANELTASELNELREYPSARDEAISKEEEGDSSSDICPGCGEALSGESGRVEGDHGEEYCSMSCLREVYSG